MATTVKMCDMRSDIAVQVFIMLNGDKVRLIKPNGFHRLTLVTDTEPKDLIYPEGWYYAKGSFRNKHMSTTGLYEEVPMRTSNGKFWDDIVNYCTL